jgi:hypothetical protein
MSPIKTAVDAFVGFLSSSYADDQYENFEAESDEKSIIAGLHLVEQLFPDQALMLCNRSHPKLKYVGRNSKDVFGTMLDYFCRRSLRNVRRPEPNQQNMQHGEE